MTDFVADNAQRVSELKSLASEYDQKKEELKALGDRLKTMAIEVKAESETAHKILGGEDLKRSMREAAKISEDEGRFLNSSKEEIGVAVASAIDSANRMTAAAGSIGAAGPVITSALGAGLQRTSPIDMGNLGFKPFPPGHPAHIGDDD